MHVGEVTGKGKRNIFRRKDDEGGKKETGKKPKRINSFRELSEIRRGPQEKERKRGPSLGR